MANFSGRKLNDMGDYTGCQYKTDSANYVLVTPGSSIYYALCVPDICSESDLEIILAAYFNFTTAVASSP
jgi:hypothetical protein